MMQTAWDWTGASVRQSGILGFSAQLGMPRNGKCSNDTEFSLGVWLWVGMASSGAQYTPSPFFFFFFFGLFR